MHTGMEWHPNTSLHDLHIESTMSWIGQEGNSYIMAWYARNVCNKCIRKQFGVAKV